MNPSDELLLQALIEGTLNEEDRTRVDDLIARSEEARRQLAEWHSWKELDISFVSMQKPPADESAQLQIAIRVMQSEVAGMGTQIAIRNSSTHDFSNDFQIDSVDSETRWIDQIVGIKVGGVIGRGAMGVVFQGFDQSLGRRVAIKIPSRHCIRNHESRERFAREAQAAAQLCHENIVAIHSIQHVDGMPILVQQSTAR